MAWVKIDTTLPRKPVVLRVMRSTGCKDRNRVVGALVQLLCWADGMTGNGELPGLTPEDIDLEIGFDGLGQALIDAGWLELFEEGLRFRDWDTHNGESAKKRALDARRSARLRDRKKEASRADRDESHASTVTDVAKVRDLDKIREDKNIHADACNARVHARESVREASAGFDNTGNRFSIQQGPATVTIEAANGNNLFLDAYKKQPKSVRAFQVEWANAVKREKPEVLIQCAKVYRENMTDEDYRFQLPPERWLADCRYEQFIKSAKQIVKQKGSALPVLPWEEEQ